MWKEFVEILHHAVEDTLPLLPWLVLIYVVIELIESKMDLKKANRLSGNLGPLIGSATGLIPQCGFSVMAAKFYEKKYITVGTLLAIFFSTSDEAFIILLSSGAEGAVWVLPLLTAKILSGILVGYAVDGFLRLIGRKQACVELIESEKTADTTREIFMQRYLSESDEEVSCSCGRKHDGESPWKIYFLYPLLHALKVAGFIFLVNFALTAIIHGIGEDKFSTFMQKSKFFQPFITSAIGLIPNCVSSVVLTETFLSGGISFGSCVAGLCANAGMGFVVLLRNVKQWKRNVGLIVFCYFAAIALGSLCNLIPLSWIS
ncbi:MAG: arsenic efflux protein [Clostridia bacterium]|nr:arsenic efflux protein [Clostridia bacterium]